ncbi:MAG TPA: hypothetical protein VFP76_00985 [Gemmatimonadota bacterium]|nr:hypothetical protein [Gemmatimonadota bacterium]
MVARPTTSTAARKSSTDWRRTSRSPAIVSSSGVSIDLIVCRIPVVSDLVA